MRDKQPVSPSADNDETYVCADCGGTGIDSERSRQAEYIAGAKYII